MNTVLCQELIRFNDLLVTIRSTLVEVQKACRGLVVMSADLEALGASLYYNQIPNAWRRASYPSLKQLSGYVQDLMARLKFFEQWLTTSPPPTFWMSGFFFVQVWRSVLGNVHLLAFRCSRGYCDAAQQAFLTGAAQNFARQFTIPIDEVAFEHDVLPHDQYDTPPEVTGIVHTSHLSMDQPQF
jgi:dynein heavy chain